VTILTELRGLVDEVHCGDSLSVLAGMPGNIADSIITSPPYYGQRDYLADSPREIGKEGSLDEYIEDLTRIFRECRRVLKPNGTFWLNLGDKFEKGNLLGTPWRVALALQSDGWYLRADIIWHKPNAMPSSVKNRPTVDHEYIFLFSKAPSGYYYDADAIREPHVTFSPGSRMRGGRGHFGRAGGTPEAGKNGGNSNLHDARWDQAFHPLGRNRRSVWSVPLSKFRDAHFAVFPERLIEPCILAGSPRNGIVLDPFLGSGTTAVVALRLGRKFIGIELSDEYCALARKRISGIQVQMDVNLTAVPPA
jgi:DNA modification methylase